MLLRALLILAICFSAGFLPAEELPQIPDSLKNYVEREEDVYNWELSDSDVSALGTVSKLSLVSQTWQGHEWSHVLEVFEANGITQRSSVLLLVVGGRNGREPKYNRSIGLTVSSLCDAPVAVIHQVPNQPLLGNRVEDDLISETWLKYLETGDENWPLLFPMVKSAVKAMDAVQEFAQTKWNEEVSGFVITGASKRGWTSWLTPVVDKRVIATAPIVIDMLNLPAQIGHQLNTWGTFSEQITDYTRKGLVKKPDGTPEPPRSAALRSMMDPYTYRYSIQIPKLIVVGTNDPYWVVDAANLYWDGLTGPKYMRQIPNAGHGLGDGKLTAVQTIAMFFRQVVAKQPLPDMNWEFQNSGNTLSLLMSSDPPPNSVKLWSAHADKRDFRKAEWKSKTVDPTDGKYNAQTEAPETGHVAIYGELQFDYQGFPYSFTTLVFVD
ncbi:PhoPQ-activated pathogenicity-related family protein [Calycomorphotria hydatis]|nr:PhoPQ-activated protein PqaA family protein [Calycomorphotria hydatis]